MGLTAAAGMVGADKVKFIDDLAMIAGVMLNCAHPLPLVALGRIAGYRLLLAGARMNPEGKARELVAGMFPGRLAEIDQLMTECREHWEAGPCRS